MHVTDQTLLEAITRGDQSAFADFFDRHAARVNGLLLCILRNPSEAEEVLQDVFWQVWTRAGQYDAARAAPLAWLTVMTRSRALDRRRRMARAPKTSPDHADQVVFEDASVPTERKEAAAAARQALEKLPIEQKEAIQRAFFDGMTHREIAEHDNLPLGTVKTRIRQGMIRLKDLLVTA